MWTIHVQKIYRLREAMVGNAWGEVGGMTRSVCIKPVNVMKMYSIPNQSRLLQLYDKHAAMMLRSISPNENYTARVKRILIEHLRQNPPDIESVAMDLSVSVRSLQMKLKEEGTSYQKILNSVRKSLAIAYLQEPKVSKGEIAQMLGFSEISVFSRTFKKWTGKSPSEYQAAFF